MPNSKEIQANHVRLKSMRPFTCRTLKKKKKIPYEQTVKQGL